MSCEIVQSPAAGLRLNAAREWLSAQRRDRPLLILSASSEAANSVLRETALRFGALFGWRGMTLARLAATLAQPPFAAENRVPVGRLALEALCARAVHRLSQEGRLGRYGVIADRPGLPRALLRTIEELRMAEATASGTDLDTIQQTYVEMIEEARFADRPLRFRVASEVARSDGALLGVPLLVLDVSIRTPLERRLLRAVADVSPAVFATAPTGDEHCQKSLAECLGVELFTLDDGSTSSLRRLQRHLFTQERLPEGKLGDDVESFSAPGESRECVEIVRRILREAERGIPFDRLAVLLHTQSYRPHLDEALRRAEVPAYFTAGTSQPDPSGRAFLALLSCAAEGLSARRFAEYLSLAEVPDATDEGTPPPAPSRGERWVPPDLESMPEVLAAQEPLVDEEESGPAALSDSLPVAGGTLRAPQRWERLLVDAAVIGGIDRWRRRLDGLAAAFKVELDAVEEPESAWAQAIRRRIADLESLTSYALPLLEVLETFRQPAVWGVWLDRLSALAARALRRPDRVLAVLGELAPMEPVGPVELREVRLVLSRRLTDLTVSPSTRPYGRVFVGSIEDVRGLTFDVVFVPGLAERMLPRKVSEDPILRDELRREIDADLETNADRAGHERLALRLAAGAAGTRLVLSHPRLDLDQARPRVPSFYGLEVVRAAEGRLPGFEEFSRRAERVGGGRIGWPAPASPLDAIDEAEYDLALLDEILRRPASETKGMARYLLQANAYLARALRARAQRWGRKWTPADGLVEPSAEALGALAGHFLRARPYSPTALQHFAACPYRFLLHGIHRLAPRVEPEAIEEMDPLQRGALVHDVLFELLGQLRTEKLLPLNIERVERARSLLEEALAAVAARYHDDLAPAIERIWEDGIAQVKADLVEWLRRAAEDDSGWTPVHFELSFGLKERSRRDPASRADPVRLDCGIVLRGSIDSVEQGDSSALRVTDYKTGKDRSGPDMVVGGGETLQPLLYALAAEKLFPGARIDGGRLYYCTFAGEFNEHRVQLDDTARQTAGVVAEVIDEALEKGFLPAAPAEDACEWCDYRVVCGPYEEQRTARKRREALASLARLRDLR